MAAGGAAHCRRTDECLKVTEWSQLLVTTHSPFFVNQLSPDQVRVLYRDTAGYTQAVRAADIVGVKEFVAEGALLGQLWLEGYLGVGDPLTNSGAPLSAARLR